MVTLITKYNNTGREKKETAKIKEHAHTPSNDKIKIERRAISSENSLEVQLHICLVYMSFPKTLNVPDKSSLLVPQTTKASATGPTTAVSYETASLEIRSIRGSPYLPSSPVDSQQFDGRSIISTSGMSEYIADLNDLPSIRHDINPTSIKTGGTGSRSLNF